MPSSTFSSERNSSWSRVWTLAVVLAVAALASWEMLWRMRGVEWAYRDDHALWSHARGRLGSPDSWPSVIIGSSRAQVDIDPEILAPVFDDVPPVVLAIGGASARPVFIHVTNQTHYGGVLLFEVNPLHVFASSPAWDEVADEFIEHYVKLPRIGRYEIDLRLAAQERMVLLNPSLEPQRIVRDLFAAEPTVAPRRSLRSDRHLELNFMSDASAARRWQAEYYRSRGTSQAIEPLVETVVRESRLLRSRGGEVVLLRLPSSGELRRIEQERFPRELYWDVLVERSGLAAIHFEDFPDLRGFDCPDGTHLNLADAREFTRRLGPILDRTLSHRSFAGGS